MSQGYVPAPPPPAAAYPAQLNPDQLQRQKKRTRIIVLAAIALNSPEAPIFRLISGGSKRKGTLYVVAKKSAGRWTFEVLELRAEGHPDLDLRQLPEAR